MFMLFNELRSFLDRGIMYVFVPLVYLIETFHLKSTNAYMKKNPLAPLQGQLLHKLFTLPLE